MIALIIIFSVAFIVLTAFLVHYFYQHKYDEFILRNSFCLKELTCINARYKFNPDVNFDQSHIYDNEKFYDTISCQDYLIYQLQDIGENVLKQIEKVSENQQAYSDYLSKVKTISDFGRFWAPIENLDKEKLIAREKYLFQKNIRPKPATQFSLTVKLHRSDRNGRIWETKSEDFDSDEICTLIMRLNNKKGKFYNDREIWDSLCRVERGKVSNKMRFSIYERDGYRCRNCGISGKFADLEIDHIIPIAKGGKSTYDNLQTLCHKCNIEKGDK